MRYLNIVLTPTQCLLVGAAMYLANKFTANAISGPVLFECSYGAKIGNFTTQQFLIFTLWYKRGEHRMSLLHIKSLKYLFYIGRLV
jgi:hypothetical protein